MFKITRVKRSNDSGQTMISLESFDDFTRVKKQSDSGGKEKGLDNICSEAGEPYVQKRNLVPKIKNRLPI